MHDPMTYCVLSLNICRCAYPVMRRGVSGVCLATLIATSDRRSLSVIVSTIIFCRISRGRSRKVVFGFAGDAFTACRLSKLPPCDRALLLVCHPSLAFRWRSPVLLSRAEAPRS